MGRSQSFLVFADFGEVTVLHDPREILESFTRMSFIFVCV